ncbi:LysR family transcriptional regulator [Ensifer adhaerens]|uniref:LysR family transcriptional regulator n=1 Tax=Ensifer adhaerens TaxID=106592 RepID=UPI00384D2707
MFAETSAAPRMSEVPRASKIKEINLASIDLNLLVALEALLTVQNVTHAGRRVGLSQPAMSRALSRLRVMFNDDLLVRTARGLKLTVKGEQLLKALPEVMGSIRQIVSGEALRTGTFNRLNIAMAEHQSIVLLPHLLPRLARHAELEFSLQSKLRGVLSDLESGIVDLAVGQIRDTPPGFFCRTLYSDRLVCLMGHENPASREPWTAERLTELRLAKLLPACEPDAELFDVMVHATLPQKDIMLLPSLAVARMMALQTNVVLILPYTAAHQATLTAPLVIRELPVGPSSHDVMLVWHERCHREPAHRILRAHIAAAACSVQAEPGK